MENIFVTILVLGCFIFTEERSTGTNECNNSNPAAMQNCSSNRKKSKTTDEPQKTMTEEATSHNTSGDNCDCSICKEGYLLSTTVHTSNAKEQDGAETSTNTIQECPSGSIVGSVIGGAVFGSLITVFVLMLHWRVQKKQIRNPLVKILQNPAYNAEILCINEGGDEEDTGKSAYSEINDQKSIKVYHAAPTRRKEYTSESKELVYNHLNETDSVDRNEYYDHAKPGASVSTPADGYGTVKLEQDHARPGASISTPADGYGTVKLEHDHARPGASISTPADGYDTAKLEYDHVRPGASVSKPSDRYRTVKLEYSGNDPHAEDDKSKIDDDIAGKEFKEEDHEYFVLEKIQ